MSHNCKDLKLTKEYLLKILTLSFINDKFEPKTINS